MNLLSNEKPLRLAILQRVCPDYRTPLFSKLTNASDVEAILFIGEDIPNSKVKNSQDLADVKFQKLRTRFITLGTRILPWQVGLVNELRKFRPDIILCEGESHFLGYVQAIYYKCVFSRRTALIHWCFISLPGWSPVGGSGFRALVKRFFRKFFDAFVVYSSYSKECLVKLDQPSEKVFVATNVGDVERFIRISDSITESVSEARSKIGLPDRFTILYVGTLDEIKRPRMMLDLAREFDRESYNFVLVGTGPLLTELQERVAHENLTNVYLPGRVVDELPLHYRAADVLLIPGRGGIVISEAMAFGVPVVTYQADGTEYDLIQNEVTGLRLAGGSVNDFRKALEFLYHDPIRCAKMGLMGRQLVESRYTTSNMVEQIIRAAQYAKSVRENLT